MDMEATTSADGTAPPPEKRRRRRQRVSCVECTRRRQKCDRQKPCGLCVARKVAHLCRWEDGPVARPEPARPPPGALESSPPTTMRELSTRVQELERIIQQHSQPQAPQQTQSSQSSTPEAVTATRSEASVFLDSLTQYAAQQAAALDNGNASTPSLGRDAREAAISLAHLALAPQGEYVAENGVISALRKFGGNPEEVPPHSNIHRSMVEILPITEPDESGSSHILGNIENPYASSLDHILRALPPREHCEELKKAYFQWMNWRFGIPENWFHHKFIRMFNALSANQPSDRILSAGSALDAHWLALLFSTFAIASPTCTYDVDENVSKASAKRDRGRHRQFYLAAHAAFRHAQDELCLAPFGAPAPAISLDNSICSSLAGAILSCYQRDHGNVSVAWVLLAQAIRQAQAAGLYRHPGRNIWISLSNEEKKLRATTWWLLASMETISSFVIGRPSMIFQRTADMSLPEHFGPFTEPPPDSGVDHRFFTYYATLGVLVGKMAETLSDVNAAYSTITQMDKQFEDWKSGLPAAFRWWQVPSDGERRPGFNLCQQRNHLAIWFLICRMNLHRHFLTHASNLVLPPPPGVNEVSSHLPAQSQDAVIDLALELMAVQRNMRPVQVLNFSLMWFVLDGAIALWGACVQGHPRADDCLDAFNSAIEMLDDAVGLEYGVTASRSARVLRILQAALVNEQVSAPASTLNGFATAHSSSQPTHLPPNGVGLSNTALRAHGAVSARPTSFDLTSTAIGVLNEAESGTGAGPGANWEGLLGATPIRLGT